MAIGSVIPAEASPSASTREFHVARVIAFLEDIASAVDRRATVVMLLVLSLTAVVVWMKCYAVPFWTDELFSWHVTGLGSLRDVIDALQRADDQQPPLYFVLTRLSRRLITGSDEFALRLPSLVGFVLGAVCVGRLVARPYGGLMGAAAVCLLARTSVLYHASNARPYGVVFGLSAAAFLAWRASVLSARLLPVIVLGATTTWLVGVQYYGSVVLVALLGGHLAYCAYIRRMIWAPAVVLTAAGATLTLYIPLIRAGLTAGIPHPWNLPSWSALPSTYQDVMAPVSLLMLVGLAASAAVRITGVPPEKLEGGPASSDPVPTLIMALTFLAIPALVFAIAMLVTRQYTDRYALAWIVGLVIVLCHGLARAARGAKAVSLAMIAVFVVLFGAEHRSEFKGVLTPHVARPQVPASVLETGAARLRVVVGSPLRFLPLQHYATESVRGRLLYASDPQAAVEITGSDTLDLALEAAGSWAFGATIVDRHGPDMPTEFLLLWAPDKPAWILPALLHDGAAVQLLDQRGDESVYRVSLSSPTAQTSTGGS